MDRLQRTTRILPLMMCHDVSQCLRLCMVCFHSLPICMRKAFDCGYTGRAHYIVDPIMDDLFESLRDENRPHPGNRTERKEAGILGPTKS